jgi:tripeptidyl-peptidase-1
MTTSYGENEAGLDPALAALVFFLFFSLRSCSLVLSKLCNAYMGLGARGTSVLFASGDGGVEGGHSQQCTTFQAAFPAVCP